MPPLSSTPLHPPLDALNYRRRCTCSVSIGTVPLGSEYPLRIQTMANVSTPDTEAGIAQTERVALAGADYMRFTAQIGLLGRWEQLPPFRQGGQSFYAIAQRDWFRLPLVSRACWGGA